MLTTIKYQDILTKEIMTKEFKNISEDHAIELLKRKYSSVGIKFIDIKTIDDELIKLQDKEIHKRRDTLIKTINKKIKAIIKNPYPPKNKCMKFYNIKLNNSDKRFIADYFNKNFNKVDEDYYKYNEYIELYIRWDDIQVNSILE